MWLREADCLACQRRFYLHLRCDRGDRYCSKACSDERRKELLLKYQAEYASSEKGKATRKKWLDQQREAKAAAEGLTEAVPVLAAMVEAGERSGLEDGAGWVAERGGSVTAAASVVTGEVEHPGPSHLQSSNTAAALAGDRTEPGMREGVLGCSIAVTDQSTSPTVGLELTVAGRPGGLATCNQSPDEAMVVGDRAGPSVYARSIDEQERPERAASTLALWAEASPGAATPVRGAGPVVRGSIHCCARCGRPGQVLRHADMV